jgi:CheY-like chemotaxis protein
MPACEAEIIAPSAATRMSQPQKLPDFSDFLPKRERRAPLPITNLPVNAITEESDPTLEIRTLIEQLQQTARDARAQALVVEEEKEKLQEKLGLAKQQIETLRATERELRSHFVEVTSLIRERDLAQDESERRGMALADSVKKLEAIGRERNEAQKQRDDILRQRDEAIRKFESFQRASEDQGRLIAETQKQILTIRQARDSAHKQALDLTGKLGQAEDQIAELGFQRDNLQKTANRATSEMGEFRRRLETVTSDRDATAKQVEQLSQELDEQRKKLLNLTEQKSAVLQEGQEHAFALNEARTQVASLTEERDTARLRSQELAQELETVRQQFQKSREEQAEQSSAALADAQGKIASLEAQARESRHEVKNLRQRLETVTEHLNALQEQAGQADVRQSEIRREQDALAHERDAALASLASAQEQFDSILRERDHLRDFSQVNTIEFEAQLTALRAQLATYEIAAEEATAGRDEFRELGERFEAQRLESIDLATKLQSAQRQIRELSASLAEARLHLKFATAANRATKNGATRADFAGMLPEMLSEGDLPLATIPGALANAGELFNEREAKSTLAAMRQCFQSFTKTPTDLSLLNELHCHVHSFSEQARTAGMLALHRLCLAFSDLTHGLYEIPEGINPSTMRTVYQTIEFLWLLMKEKRVGQAKDPAKAHIYAVDDDVDNCESIRMAMETTTMRTSYAHEPAIALAELAGTPCDLILLDVNLPGMDGFELCKQIRTQPMHANTPVVFVTGLSTMETRVQSSLSGGNDFIGKPFNLSELCVKVLTLTLKSQLKIV